MRAALIVNPRSGRGRLDERLTLARRLASAAGVPIDVVATERRGHAASLADRFVRDGVSRVIAWGGDGTVNETAGPLIGTATVLGIVRGGSGDGLARGLGVPRDEKHALLRALVEPARPIDIGWLGGRHFLNVAGIGFDAEVAAAFNRRTHRGPAGYVAEVWRTLWSYRCAAYALQAGDFSAHGSLLLMAFANGRQYGTGLTIAPDAGLADGALNLVVAAGGSPLVHCWRARRLFWRRLAPARGIERRLVQHASVQGDRLFCHVDGETFEATGKVEVRVQRGALLVAAAIAPADTTSGARRDRSPSPAAS